MTLADGQEEKEGAATDVGAVLTAVDAVFAKTFIFTGAASLATWAELVTWESMLRLFRSC